MKNKKAVPTMLRCNYVAHTDDKGKRIIDYYTCDCCGSKTHRLYGAEYILDIPRGVSGAGSFALCPECASALKKKLDKLHDAWKEYSDAVLSLSEVLGHRNWWEDMDEE